MPPLEIPCISYKLQTDPMRGEEWIAFTMVVIPVKQNRTIDIDYVIPLYPTQSVSVTGKSREDALARLSEYVGDLLSWLPEVASSTLRVTPKRIPRPSLVPTPQKAARR